LIEKITCMEISVFARLFPHVRKKKNTKYKIYSYIKCIFVMHCGICFKNAYAYDLVVSSSLLLINNASHVS